MSKMIILITCLKSGDLLLEGAHPPYSLKNDDLLRENVINFDKNREGDHVCGDNGRNRYVEDDHVRSVEDDHAGNDWEVDK